jgi:hypothetical protein
MPRPTKYKPEYAKQAAKLCEMGATDKELADFFEVSESTLNLWKLRHERFSESLKLGKEPANEKVKRSLYHRAVGYSHPEDDIRVVSGEIVITPTTKHYPPDTTACIFFLKNRLPEEFRANPEESPQEASGKVIEVVRANRAD